MNLPYSPSKCILPIATRHCRHNSAQRFKRIKSSARRTALTYKIYFSVSFAEHQLCITSWTETPKIVDLIASPTPTPPHAIKRVFGIVLESRPSNLLFFLFALKKLFDQTKQCKQTQHQDHPTWYRVRGIQQIPDPRKATPDPQQHFAEQTA